MLSAYKLGTMIKISNELLHDSAFDLATYIAQRFGVRMGNAEEKAFITGDGVGKPTGLLDDAGAQVGVTAAAVDAVTFDEIFQLYYSLKSPYRRKAQFLCNEALVLQLMTIKDNNGNYIWKPGLDIGKPDTLLNRPLKTSAFMPAPAAGNKAMVFGRLQLLLDRGPHQPHLPPPERAVCPHRPGRLPDHPACGRQAHPAGSGEVPADEGRGLMGRRCRAMAADPAV